jgi:hypothetical protein
VGVIIPVGFAQVSMDMYLTGDPEVQTTTLGLDVDAGDDDPAVLADTVFNIVTGTNRPFALSRVQNIWTIGPFRCTIMTATGPLTGVGAQVLPGTGSVGGLPQNCSWLIRKSTARGGRKGRGRMYVPPCDLMEGNVSETGVINSSIRNTHTTEWNSVRTDLTTAGNAPVLLHSDGTVPDTITVFTCDNRIASQRRRLRK